jgi:hypothetical protein
VGVLITRLRELPAVAERLEILLERDVEDLRWMPDASEDEFAPRQEIFRAEDFALNEPEKAEIEKTLGLIEEMLGMRR